MIYLVDSNVVSEWLKPNPNKNVFAWKDVVTWRIPAPAVAEMQEGAINDPSTRRRADNVEKIQDFVRRFSWVIADWDGETALTWAGLKHTVEVKRRPQALWDSLIDAMGVRYGFTVATRNGKDFRHSETFNPWNYRPQEN